MVDDTKDDAALDALFLAAKATPPAPSDDFMARLAADADASLPKPVRPVPTPAPRFNFLKGLFAASGLSGAAVLGLWIGFIMPETISPLTLTSDETVALYTFLPGADLAAAGLAD